ncbi:hypothetical protein F5148DRAFT_630216 [Russula earlei]|uniref:Uncharacterized protein n=1 Tax=Russula earlei TaxID=71964 RepID=A0ACC0UEJ1_9AGAM|nr:hypothetical protein F5148DRAFT_630216 [Russula earlei]
MHKTRPRRWYRTRVPHLLMSMSQQQPSLSNHHPASADPVVPSRAPSISRKIRIRSDDDHDHSQPIHQQSCADANQLRDGPSASTSQSSRQKADNVSAAALPLSLSLTLQNTGSVARDHLASERTFLAYVRTSLSFSGAGVALVQLFRVSVNATVNDLPGNEIAVAPYARPLGATLIAFGMVVLAMGTLRYFTIQRALPQGLFPCCPPQYFFAGSVSRGASRGRLWHPCRIALNYWAECRRVIRFA